MYSYLVRTIAALCVAFNVAVGAAAAPQSAHPHWQDDAELRDVHFANLNEGWAVGDRGVIWHTADGGRDWSRQQTSVNCRLSGVSFADALRGWAVGGAPYAFAPGGRGVVLATVDGGQTWRQESASLLSSLHGVKAFTTHHAQAWGERSSIFPLSCYWTVDDGRSWNPFSGSLADDVVDATFSGPQLGAAITRRGQVLRIDDRRVEPVQHPPAGLRGLNCVRFGDGRRGVVVGDGGLIWLTHDGGSSWQAAPAELPDEALTRIDFRAAALRGEQLWIAGSPGSVILYSPDFGRSWRTFTTRQSLPLNRLEFVDDAHGWAVGALGLILATADGGRTWQKQRAGGDRAAIVGVFADAESTPWELYAKTCGQEGGLGHTVCLLRRDWLRREDADREASPRLSAAMGAVGGSSAERAWRFPTSESDNMPSSESIVAFWNKLHEGRALELLEFELVKQMRTWRPAVVCTHGAQNHQTPGAYLINQAVLRAAELAGDEAYRADEFAALGLPAWRVNKVYGQLPPGGSGGETIAATQLAPELGRSLGQQSLKARAVVCDRPGAPTDVIGFQLLMSDLPESASGRGFLGGANLPPGGGARRMAATPLERGGGEQLKRLAVRQRNLQALLTGLDDDRESQVALGQLPELIASLPAESAAALLFELATRYEARGRADFAAQTHGLLVERFPDCEWAAPSLVWLIQYWSSGEVDWRRQFRHDVAQRAESRSGRIVDRAGDVELTSYAPEELGWGNQELTAAHDPEARRTARASRVQALERLLAKTRPTLAAEPLVTFPAAVVARPSTAGGDVSRWRTCLQSRADDAWRRWALAELARVDRRVIASPVAQWNCRRVSARPKLDGILDDDAWRQAGEIDLAGIGDDAEAWPTTLAAARDDEFLYFAVAAAKPGAGEYDEERGARRHDDDLSANDRVEIALDIDRDYVTAWRLSVDYLGRVRDDCAGDASWNPKWYVAAKQDERAWYVEAAIPWDQLTPTAPATEEAWCAKVRRVAPGVGQQHWASPADNSTSLESGGWLVFE